MIGGNVSEDKISISGGREDLDNAPGLVIAAEWTFYRKDALRLGVNLNFLALSTESDTREQGVVVSDRFGVAAPSVPVSTTYTYLFKQDGLGTASTSGFVDYDVDLDAYTFALGVSGAYDINRFGACFGFGPTLTLAEMDTDVRETVQWSGGAPVNPGQTLSQRSQSDHETAFLFGAYASLGLTCKVTESVTACLEYRYDYLFSEIKNDVAEADLSGGSVQASVKLRF